MFSENPIVVLHLGSRAPDTWTAERFPRLWQPWHVTGREIQAFSDSLQMIEDLRWHFLIRLAPRILLHAAPMGPEVHRSFNFNKLRSFLISRELPSEKVKDFNPFQILELPSLQYCFKARVGVELDSDQFVGPGVDYMLLDCTKPLNQSSPFTIETISQPSDYLNSCNKGFGSGSGYSTRFQESEKASTRLPLAQIRFKQSLHIFANPAVQQGLF